MVRCYHRYTETALMAQHLFTILSQRNAITLQYFIILMQARQSCVRRVSASRRIRPREFRTVDLPWSLISGGERVYNVSHLRPVPPRSLLASNMYWFLAAELEKKILSKWRMPARRTLPTADISSYHRHSIYIYNISEPKSYIKIHNITWQFPWNL